MEEYKVHKYISIFFLIFAFHAAILGMIGNVLNLIGGCNISDYSNDNSCYVLNIQVGHTISWLLGYSWNTFIFVPIGVILSVVFFVIFKVLKPNKKEEPEKTDRRLF